MSNTQTVPNNNRTVWVLGAGFSKPLGGPLLTRLLSLSSYQDIRVRHSDAPTVRSVHTFHALRLYHYGRRFPEGKVLGNDPNLEGETMWEHAEEYLDVLDAAAASTQSEPSVMAKRLADIASKYRSDPLRRFDPKDLPSINAEAKRLVALECWPFAAEADVEREERWTPYRKWAEQLGPDDTIINFNYDLVVERLGGPAHRFPVPLPNQVGVSRKPAPTMLKLHGSVDWKRICDANGALTGFEKTDPAFLTTCDGQDFAIGTPGPGKQSTATEYKALWEAAVSALTKAASVVFVGYRFPPTDAVARESLLDAIQQNDQPVVAFHVVLGPDTKGPNVARLVALLEYAAQAGGRTSIQPGKQYGKKARLFTVKPHPLYSEDFVGVWHRRLTEPAHVGWIV